MPSHARRQAKLFAESPRTPTAPIFHQGRQVHPHPSESEVDFARLSSFFLNRLKPDDHIESILVQRMVVAQWQLLRVWGVERLAIITAPEDDSEDPAIRCYSNFLGLHAQSRAGNAFQISAQRYQRQFDQALAQFERLRGNVSFLPNPRSRLKQRATSENPEPTPDLRDPKTDLPSTHPVPTAQDHPIELIQIPPERDGAPDSQ